MLPSKYTNPDCSAAFDYRLGRIFRFTQWCPNQRTASTELERFWLCERCELRYEVRYKSGSGLLVSLQWISKEARQREPSREADLLMVNSFPAVRGIRNGTAEAIEENVRIPMGNHS